MQGCITVVYQRRRGILAEKPSSGNGKCLPVRFSMIAESCDLGFSKTLIAKGHETARTDSLNSVFLPRFGSPPLNPPLRHARSPLRSARSPSCAMRLERAYVNGGLTAEPWILCKSGVGAFAWAAADELPASSGKGARCTKITDAPILKRSQGYRVVLESCDLRKRV